MKDIKKIDDLSKSLEQSAKYLESVIGDIDMSKEDVVLPGPILHQSSEQMTEKESAQYELDNPELSRFFHMLDHQLQNILSK